MCEHGKADALSRFHRAENAAAGATAVHPRVSSDCFSDGHEILGRTADDAIIIPAKEQYKKRLNFTKRFLLAVSLAMHLPVRENRPESCCPAPCGKSICRLRKNERGPIPSTPQVALHKQAAEIGMVLYRHKRKNTDVQSTFGTCVPKRRICSRYGSYYGFALRSECGVSKPSGRNGKAFP